MLEWEKLPGGAAAAAAAATTAAQRARVGYSATPIGSSSKLLVFGGRCGKRIMDDLWEFDLRRERWRRLQEHAPFASVYHSATLVGKNKLWFIGGFDAETVREELRVLDTDTLEWSTPRCQGLSRACHAAVLHPIHRERILVFGGRTSSSWFGDLSLLDTVTLEWTTLRPEGIRPGPRGYASLTAFGHSVLLLGGVTRDDVPQEDELSVYDSIDNKWAKIRPCGGAACPRTYHTAALVSGNRIVVHAGRCEVSHLNDCHLLEISGNHYQWQKQGSEIMVSGGSKPNALSSPGSLAGSSLVACNDTLYMLDGYGGRSGDVFCDVYVVRRLEQALDPIHSAKTSQIRTPPASVMKDASSGKRKLPEEQRVSEREVRKQRFDLNDEFKMAAEIEAEFETFDAEKQILQREADEMRNKVAKESTKASSLGQEVHEQIAPDSFSRQLQEASATKLEAISQQLRSVEKKLDDRGREVEQLKSYVVREVKTEIQSHMQALQQTLQQMLQQTKSDYDAEVAETSAALGRHVREKEALSISNAALFVELQQVKAARDAAEYSLLLLKKDRESATALVERKLLQP